MKNLLNLLLLIIFVFTPVLIFGQDDGGVIDFKDPVSVLTWIMPVLTLGATWLVKKVAPFINGTVTLIVVPIISSALAYFGTMADGSSSWIVLFVSGIASVFLNQFYRSVTAGQN
tara:strand:+ start:29977 stop:30321 length:345 start_codon:yes stop_codon:yes gene_type:complete